MRQLFESPIPMFSCPTRRSGLWPWTLGAGPYYTADAHGNTFTISLSSGEPMARGDYAASAGDQGADEKDRGPTDIHNQPPSDDNDYSGVIYRVSNIRFSDITRGTSHTFLLGERYLNPDHYFDGQDLGDNEALYCGFDNDNSRDTHDVPLQDRPGLFNDQRFGSAHLGGLNMLICDGSVQFITFDVSLDVWRPAGNRNLDPNFVADPW
jgi:hypothetical protein